MLTGSRVSEVLKNCRILEMLITVYQSLLLRSMDSVAAMILQPWIFSLCINCGVLRPIKEFRDVI